MRTLVTGGSKGLGLALVNAFNADSVCRANGYDITNADDIKRIVELSMECDMFINNAFDGPPHEAWANFAQTNLLFEIYQAWNTAKKSGYIINIGSIGEKSIKEPEPMFETYRTSKAALAFASKQCTQAFKNNIVKFKTTLITPDRLDTDLTRSRPSWTGNGINVNDIVSSINFITSCHGNTVIDEITLFCNLTYTN